MIFTAREFNQYTTKAQKCSQQAPVFITNRGRFESVLLNYEEYQRLVGKKQSLAQALAMESADRIELEFERDQAPISTREVEF